VHHYDDPHVEHALTQALGKRILEAATSQIPNDGFPKELKMAKTSYPVICTPFNKNPPNFNSVEIEIYVTPSQKFTIKPRNVFTTELKHITSKEAYKWLRGPDMSYYPQQLAFALWGSSSGCGIGIDMLTKYRNPMIESLLKFHILFTSRRILSQMAVQLPGDQNFTNIDNKYSKSGYHKVCREFDISTNSDFRFTGDENHGLGRIYKKIFDEVDDVTEAYDEKIDGKETDKWPNGAFKFGDEGSWGGNKIDHISPLKKLPYRYFLLNESKGLTRAGLSRLNQSIEAYVYCILGSQVNTRSSIYGNSGSAQETQRVFLQLFESAIIETDVSKSIQRYQLAIQEAKVKLDTAVAIGCWLLPSSLVINNNSVVGYNNKLIRASADMQFGVNNINDKKPIVIQHNMGDSKVIHQKTNNFIKPSPSSKTHENNFIKPSPSSKTHKNNLVVITVIAAGLAWICFR